MSIINLTFMPVLFTLLIELAGFLEDKMSLKNGKRDYFSAVAAIFLLGLFLLPVFAQEPNQQPAQKAAAESDKAKERPAVLSAGTTLHVRLDTTLTSKTSKTGDVFKCMVLEPVVVNGKKVVDAGTLVYGHVAFVKPSGRFKGLAEMRLVLDYFITPDNEKVALRAGLEDTSAGSCAKIGSDNEGTIKGCGKDAKGALKNSAMGAAVGAGAGASVGMGKMIDCRYYGNCGGPGMAEDVALGAGIGAASVLVYHLLKHEKQIVLVTGTVMNFLINRSVAVNPEGYVKPDGTLKKQRK